MVRSEGENKIVYLTLQLMMMQKFVLFDCMCVSTLYTVLACSALWDICNAAAIYNCKKLLCIYSCTIVILQTWHNLQLSPKVIHYDN